MNPDFSAGNLKVKVFRPAPLGPARVVTQARWHLVKGFAVQCDPENIADLQSAECHGGIIGGTFKCLARQTRSTNLPVRSKDDLEDIEISCSTGSRVQGASNHSDDTEQQNKGVDSQSPKHTFEPSTDHRWEVDGDGAFSPSKPARRASQPIMRRRSMRDFAKLLSPAVFNPSMRKVLDSSASPASPPSAGGSGTSGSGKRPIRRSSTLFEEHMLRMAKTSVNEEGEEENVSETQNCSKDEIPDHAVREAARTPISPQPSTLVGEVKQHSSGDNANLISPARDVPVMMTTAQRFLTSLRGSLPTTATMGHSDSNTANSTLPATSGRSSVPRSRRIVAKGKGEASTPTLRQLQRRRGSLLDRLSPSLRFASILLASQVKKKAARVAQDALRGAELPEELHASHLTVNQRLQTHVLMPKLIPRSESEPLPKRQAEQQQPQQQSPPSPTEVPSQLVRQTNSPGLVSFAPHDDGHSESASHFSREQPKRCDSQQAESNKDERMSDMEPEAWGQTGLDEEPLVLSELPSLTTPVDLPDTGIGMTKDEAVGGIPARVGLPVQEENAENTLDQDTLNKEENKDETENQIAEEDLEEMDLLSAGMPMIMPTLDTSSADPEGRMGAGIGSEGEVTEVIRPPRPGVASPHADPSSQEEDDDDDEEVEELMAPQLMRGLEPVTFGVAALLPVMEPENMRSEFANGDDEEFVPEPLPKFEHEPETDRVDLSANAAEALPTPPTLGKSIDDRFQRIRREQRARMAEKKKRRGSVL